MLLFSQPSWEYDCGIPITKSQSIGSESMTEWVELHKQGKQWRIRVFNDCIIEDALVETAPCFGSGGEGGGWDEIDVVVVDVISKG